MFFGDIFLLFISRKRTNSKVWHHPIYPQVYTHIHLYKINLKITFPHYPQSTKKLSTFYIHNKTHIINRKYGFYPQPVVNYVYNYASISNPGFAFKANVARLPCS